MQNNKLAGLTRKCERYDWGNFDDAESAGADLLADRGNQTTGFRCSVLFAGDLASKWPMRGWNSLEGVAKVRVQKPPYGKDIMRAPAILNLTVTMTVLAASLHAADKPNVLFIAVDDLRPELNCYGAGQIHSPNIDRLASEGTLFSRAYCQQAVCNPSRASLMTGLRPDTLKVYDLKTNFRDTTPWAVSIPQVFKDNGYFTQAIGKIYHGGHGLSDDVISWSEPQITNPAPRFGPEGMKVSQREKKAYKAAGRKPSDVRGLPYENADVADNELRDGKAAEIAIDMIRAHKDEPFFIGVGFLNPHLPFVSPKKYWELYDEGDIKLPENMYPPKDAPSYAGTSWGELRQYVGIPEKGPVDKEQAREMIHGYYAAVSYVDACVGKLLDELDSLKLRDDTIVILWGDHGWQLGEHSYWCKHTNYDVATRVPLIISVPGQKAVGSPSNALVEFVDIFPTLTEAAGMPTPDRLEGHSFLPLTDNPTMPWKSAAFHLYPRGGRMGHGMRTDRHHLIEWTNSKTGKFDAVELYDLVNDPQENTNIAASNADLVEELTQKLHAGWEAALPKQ